VLEANGVGQIATDSGGHKFRTVGGGVGEPRREQREEPAHLLCTLLGRIRPGQGHRVLLDHIASRGAGSPLQIAFSASIWRGRTSARNCSSSVIGDLLFGGVVLNDLTRGAVCAPSALVHAVIRAGPPVISVSHPTLSRAGGPSRARRVRVGCC
jgi:hypothetical protein